jgi:hypothetical protein
MGVEQAASPPPKPEEQWTGVATAYEWARPWYDIMLKRFEIIEGRVRALLTLAATLTLGAPVFASAAHLAVRFDSPWVWSGLICFGILLVAGVAAYVRSWVTTYDPGPLRTASTQYSAWEIQRIALKNADEAWRTNRTRLARKGGAADTMAILLIAELACLVAWIISAL